MNKIQAYIETQKTRFINKLIKLKKTPPISADSVKKNDF